MGPRIEKLLAWAASHSPRTKELRRFIQDWMLAANTDITNLRRGLDMTIADRNRVSALMIKIARAFTRVEDPQRAAYFEEEMTEEEFRLYAAARVNQGVMEAMKKGAIGPELVKSLAEQAFEEVLGLGASENLIADMRANLERSLVVETLAPEEPHVQIVENNEGEESQ